MYLLSTDIETHKQEGGSSGDEDLSLHEINETEQMVEWHMQFFTFLQWLCLFLDILHKRWNI